MEQISRKTFRYATILLNGDSKAYDAVTALNVYGLDVSIEKDHCMYLKDGNSTTNFGKCKTQVCRLVKRRLAGW